MNESREEGLGVGVLIAANVISLPALFSDLGPMEPAWMRIAAIAGLFVAAGAAIGWLLPKRWYLALLACGSPALLGVFALSMRLRTGGPPPYWSFLALELVGPPVIALLCSFIASRLRRSRLRG